jgi:predicted peptidase
MVPQARDGGTWSRLQRRSTQENGHQMQPTGRTGQEGLTVQELQQRDWTALSTRYLLYRPAEDVARPLPLLLFLHGAGERGDNLQLVCQHGIARLLSEGAELPFLVVAPQCPMDERWNTESLLRLLDMVERSEGTDPDRVYVTGLSMGGRGTWSLAIAAPRRFAAIAPVCGAGDPSAVRVIARLPVWAFHGARDPVVPLQRSIEMVEALRACGGNVRLTIYPEAEHDSWTETYANPELYTWLLAQRRPATG